jgi:putative ABC transport system permease protein
VEPETVDLEYVFPRFFETWGVPVLLGREFLSDGETAVAVVNEAFARRYYGGGSPIGGTVAPCTCPGTPHRIVGMVADHVDRQRADLVPMIYLPYPTGGALEPNTFALRTTGEPRLLIPSVRRLIGEAGFNSDGDVSTGTAYRDRTTQQERFLSRVLGVFAILALFVASLGVYGMLNYAAISRSGEVAIRMALGAKPSSVRWMIVGEAFVPVLLGAAAGAGVTLGVARLADSLMFGVEARDPLTLGVTLLVLVATGVLTALLPARRAARVDPLHTLRHE